MSFRKQANLECSVSWNSDCASHTDCFCFQKIDFRRDIFPGRIGEEFSAVVPGEGVTGRFEAGEILPGFDESKHLRIHRNQWKPRGKPVYVQTPGVGRYYPRGFLSGIGGIHPRDRHPFRLLADGGDGYEVDLNHPLSRFPLIILAKVEVPEEPEGCSLEHEQRGGRCNDITAELADNGPGMQAVTDEIETDFYSNDPFRRVDEEDDSHFYLVPRLVNHIDTVAMARIQQLYGRLLKPGMRVLDLMSSWNSHLPDSLAPLSVTGVGLNRTELESNRRLADFQVHDLNREPILHTQGNSYDAAVCTVSVEYLNRPLEVFREVARLLKPGAPFIVTFSERWFPTKVIRLWTELHPFERLGLVVDYFRRSEAFDHISTETYRGQLRPADDRYAGINPLSDPVYAVWATCSQTVTYGGVE